MLGLEQHRRAQQHRYGVSAGETEYFYQIITGCSKSLCTTSPLLQKKLELKNILMTNDWLLFMQGSGNLSNQLAIIILPYCVIHTSTGYLAQQSTRCMAAILLYLIILSFKQQLVCHKVFLTHAVVVPCSASTMTLQ